MRILMKKSTRKWYVSYVCQSLAFESQILQHIDPEDANALDVFLPANAEERRTLADIIFEKLQNAEEGDDAVVNARSGREPRGIAPSEPFSLYADRGSRIERSRSYRRTGSESSCCLHQVSFIIFH